MAFRVTARTLLHLGAELISSDSIAFYELIKNALDAGSERVRVNVVIRIPYDDYRDFLDKLSDLKETDCSKEQLAKLSQEMLSAVDTAAPGASQLKRRIAEADSWNNVQDALMGANYIAFQDKGEGMSIQDLSEIYLTIGTRSRLKQREQQSSDDVPSINTLRPILGEKGIGRLSAMRLGQRLRVRTSRTGERHWNMLDIDWSWFSHDSDALIHEIEVTPRLGDEKDDPSESGTTVHISGLESNWNKAIAESIAREEFSKLTDPFKSSSRNPITLRYNSDALYIPPFDKLLFEHSHAFVEAKLLIDDEKLSMTGRIDYRQKKHETTFELREADLVSISKSPPALLRSLGPFSLQLYWYNRKHLSAIDGIGELSQVRELQARWAGGLMLYRDGFRVNPYGSPEDDWLSLDKKALGAKSYKINRRQIIGKVDIASVSNPRLVDQTNREGLRDCDEKRAFVLLLQHVIMTEFKRFMERVDVAPSSDLKPNFQELEERVETHERKLSDSIDQLIQRHPEVKHDAAIIDDIREAAGQVRHLMDDATRLADSFQRGHSEMVHLAGLGLMVEVVAHELNRAAEHALSTLGESSGEVLPGEVKQVLNTLEVQLKTLKKRLSILDPLSTTQRQTKETFDLVTWTEEAIYAHEGQFRRHGIRCEVMTYPVGASLNIKAVKGMVIQVLENLVSNSVYWLKQQCKLQSEFRPEISVVIDTRAKEIRFSDNGPGVPPARKEDIFEPFMTTKPPGEGKGLGLFISREIARYNGAALYLVDEHTARADALNTFVFALEGKTE